MVVACLSVTVLNSDSTRFPPPLLQPLLMGNGQCGGKVFASRGWWEALGKAGTRGLENHATLAINVFVKPFKKSRWRVELEEFYL